jgi:hypothetical protein
MEIFDNGILCLTEVHGVVTKPRDLTKEQFDSDYWLKNYTIHLVVRNFILIFVLLLIKTL